MLPKVCWKLVSKFASFYGMVLGKCKTLFASFNGLRQAFLDLYFANL